MTANMNPAPPEPREPAAREAATRIATLVTSTHGGCKTIDILRCNIERLGTEVVEAYSAELRAALAAAQRKQIFCVWCDAAFDQKTGRRETMEMMADHMLKCPKHPYPEMFRRAEAAERSLLQARTELIPAVQSLLEWMPKYSIGSSGYMRQERVMKALLARTSAPEGT